MRDCTSEVYALGRLLYTFGNAYSCELLGNNRAKPRKLSEILQGGGMITAWFAGDIDVFMESSSPFVISLMCICKYINYTYNHKQVCSLPRMRGNRFSCENYTKLFHINVDEETRGYNGG